MKQATTNKKKLSILLSTGLVFVLLFIAPTVVTSQEAAQLRDTTATVNGLTVHFQIGGDGPVLLMLHGFTLTGSQWVPLAGEFMGKYTVVIADLPGHGGTSPLPDGWSYKGAASVMFGLLDELGADTVTAFGHSAGGMTLLHMAKRQPGRFRAIVSCGGSYKFGDKARDYIREDTWEALPQEFKDYYIDLHPGGEEQSVELFKQYNGLADNHEEVTLEAMTQIPIRIMLIWGDRDEYFPVRMAVEMYEALPNAQLWVVPNQGHTPFWPEYGGSPEVQAMFSEVVTSFLGESE